MGLKHTVSRPTPPFPIAGGRLVVHQVPSAADNLVWIAVCAATGEAAAVDGPEAGSSLEYCQANGIDLRVILNTHTHGDHIGINHDLRSRGLLDRFRVVGPAARAREIPGLTDGVGEGDAVHIGDVIGRVMVTEGHLNGHVSFVFDGAVFCGDTMFAGGCGYLFDGPPAKMHHSLERLAALPGDTRVCCAHEYTQDNLRFAWSVEPDNAALAERIRQVWTVRSDGGCAVPSTIAEERGTNPFLRHHSPTLRETVAAAWPDRDLGDSVAVFAATRALKDRKLYRAVPESQLPLG